jgi:hypothetical protein
MNKLFLSLSFFAALSLAVNAQTPAPVPGTMPYGKIDKADLEMKACDFEKDANAEVLFEKGDVYFDQEFNIILEEHRRIKIFNDNGKDYANIKILYYSINRAESVSDVQAETINLVNGQPEITKLDKKQLFVQNIDKNQSAIVFSFPNVKSGSVIEYKFKKQTLLITRCLPGTFKTKYRFGIANTAPPYPRCSAIKNRTVRGNLM